MKKKFERRLNHYQKNDWRDPLAADDPDWRIRYEFYRHNNWSHGKAFFDEDPTIVEAYRRHHNFESNYG